MKLYVFAAVIIGLIVGPVRAADPNILSRREQSAGWKLLFTARRSEAGAGSRVTLLETGGRPRMVS